MHNIFIIVAALGPDVFDMDKPVVFAYEEIFSSTDGFSDSNLLGHGTYGSVYYSLLRDQVFSFILEVCYYIQQVFFIFFSQTIFTQNPCRKLLLKK